MDRTTRAVHDINNPLLSGSIVINCSMCGGFHVNMSILKKDYSKPTTLSDLSSRYVISSGAVFTQKPIAVDFSVKTQ